jgi:anti-anti-sigma regulatory factor
MTYAITGALTVEEVEDHGKALRDAVASGSTDTLTVDLSGLTTFDLLGLQLLYSLQRQCNEANLALVLSGEDNLRRLGNMIAFCGLPPLEDRNDS